jgi:hypothetical protein
MVDVRNHYLMHVVVDIHVGCPVSIFLVTTLAYRQFMYLLMSKNASSVQFFIGQSFILSEENFVVSFSNEALNGVSMPLIDSQLCSRRYSTKRFSPFTVLHF